MGIELKNKDFIKKNQKMTKLISVVLVGVLILIVAIPTKKVSKDYNLESSNTLEKNTVTYRNEEEEYASYYEKRLVDILEKTYGKGNIDVMITLSRRENSKDYFKEGNNSYTANGVLVVAKIDDDKALSDITFSVCALFDLPAHKVAVMIKK